ncbi:signal peptidase II [candidate division KSB1 bacterium]|nr:signal peptidase II [candidate division KSB1 bacterium]
MKSKHLPVLLVAFGIFIIDQITKYMIKTSMSLHQSFGVIGDFFRITYVENTGMAFGISIGENVLFTVFAAAASIAILSYFFYIKGEHLFARLAMIIIFGGALGNLTDRIFRGSVVDFLDFEFFDIYIPQFDFLFIHFPGYSMTRWPVFNVADIAVSVGMIMLMIFVIFDKEHETGTEEIIAENN